MSTINLLYQNFFPVNDKIHVYIPTVGEILRDEDLYYGMLSRFTSMPIDMMVQLDDVGIDFTEINDYQLFLLMFNELRKSDTSLILGDLDLSKFELAVNEQNGNIVLLNKDEDIVIDRAIHGKIANTLRNIHHIEKNTRMPANVEAKEFLLKRARLKMNRRKNRSELSHLESLIVAIVNTEQFKYNYEEVLDLSIYQFNESVRQIIKKIDYDNRMYGVYAGTVSVNDLSPDDLSWLTHK